jgi:hypothetical protein
MNRFSVLHPKGFIRFLFFYHLAFAFVFTWYLNQYGGDAIRYWSLTAETGHNPETWSDHFGTRSYFIQWLNYLPSHILGLPFWLGNVIYALLSFTAIRMLFKMAIKVLPPNPSIWTLGLLYLVFILPNLHFWTSGIGKESLSLMGLVLFLKGSQKLNKAWYWFVLGIFLSYMVRPLQGTLLLGIALPVIWLDREISYRFKILISPIIVVVAWYMIQFLLYITHMEQISPADIVGFSEEQFRFLDQFEAASSVAMQEYSWPMKLWTLFFRPMLWESTNIWQVFAGIENFISLLLFLLPILLLKKFNWRLLPLWIYWALLFGLALMVVYGLTLNNLGIIMRMKSFFIIFFHLSGLLAMCNYGNIPIFIDKENVKAQDIMS